jgi:hypothetical protein
MSLKYMYAKERAHCARGNSHPAVQTQLAKPTRGFAASPAAQWCKRSARHCLQLPR